MTRQIGILLSAIILGSSAGGVLTQSQDYPETPVCIQLDQKHFAFQKSLAKTGVRAKMELTSSLIDSELELYPELLDGYFQVFRASQEIGLKNQDTIRRINGSIINSYKTFTDIITATRGTTVQFEVLRAGSVRSVEVSNSTCKTLAGYLRIDSTMQQMLYSGKPVHMLLDVEPVTVFPEDIRVGTLEKIKIQQEFYGIYTSYLSQYSQFRSFALIDRSKIGLLFGEVRSQQLGLIDQKQLLQLGQLTGANFLFTVRITVIPPDEQSKRMRMVTYHSLIDIERGEVTISDSTAMEFRVQ